jgi:hypothetical protein
VSTPAKAFELLRGHQPTGGFAGAWYEGRLTCGLRLVAVRYSSNKRQGEALYHHTFSENVYIGHADPAGDERAPAVESSLVLLGIVSHFEVENEAGRIVRMVTPPLAICADADLLARRQSPVYLVSPVGTRPRVAICHTGTGPRMKPRIEPRGIVD